jgi:hypothetical protein
MLYFIQIGLISSGITSCYITYKKYLNLKDKINSEQIYTNIEQNNNIYNQYNKEIIIKIQDPYSFSLKNSNYLIGEILLEKVTPIKIINKYHDIEYNGFLNKFEKIKKQEIYYKYKIEPIKKQVLFPNIFSELNLSNNLLSLNKIKVLFNNTSIEKSDNTQFIFDLYNKNIKNNIPNYCSDTIINLNDSFQIKKNFLLPGSDLFLLIEFSNQTNYTNDHFLFKN